MALRCRERAPSTTPKPAICTAATNLLDDLIGEGKQRRRHGDAQRPGGLEVHDHLEFCRKLHREIARLLAAQNAIHIGGGATKEVYLVDSVGEQTAISGKDR